MNIQGYIINVNNISYETLKELAYLLDERPQKFKEGFNVLCPAHDDTNASLSLSISPDKRLLMFCHAGCSYQDIVNAIRKKFGVKLVSVIDLPKGVLKEVSERGGKKKYYFKNLWAYRNEEGEIIGYVVRYEDNNGKKTIRPYFKRDKKGYWKQGQLKKRPIYNLDLISKYSNANILFVEGEKCAELAQQMFDDIFEDVNNRHKDYWIATTICGGSNAINKADLSPLEGRNIYILPDADYAGIKLAIALFEKLYKYNNVEFVSFEKLFNYEYGSKLDIADWLCSDNGYILPEHIQDAIVGYDEIVWYLEKPVTQEKKRKVLFDKVSKAIYKQVVTKEGEIVWEEIENYVVWPKAILKNIFTHEPEGYKIEILTQNSNLEREVILNKITVNKLESLSLPPENLRLVTSELVRKFQDEEDITVEMLADKIGWLDNETFIHPILTQDVNWKIMGEGVVQKMAMFNSRIDEKEARENIKKIFKIMIDSKYPVFTVMLFALQVLHNPENKIFFEITGTTSTGKSVLLKTIAMLLGWSTKGWNQTYNYLVKYISSFEQYPVFIDEAHLASNPKMIVDIIYMLTQGEDRGRLNKDSEAREQKDFNTSIITTGEKSVIDAIEQINDVTPYGALARTLNIITDDIIFDQSTCVKILSMAKKSAGWLLKLWLREHNRDSYKEVFESDNMFLSSEDHQLHALNIFPVMFEVLKDLKGMDLLDKKYFTKAEIQLNRYLQQVKENFKSEIEITNEDFIKEKFEEYLIQHLDKFENIHGDENFKGERWGWKDGNDIYILGNPLKEILKNTGLPQRLKRDGRRPKWLDKKKKMISAINSCRRVYFISLEKIKEQSHDDNI